MPDSSDQGTSDIKPRIAGFLVRLSLPKTVLQRATAFGRSLPVANGKDRPEADTSDLNHWPAGLLRRSVEGCRSDRLGFTSESS